MNINEVNSRLAMLLSEARQDKGISLRKLAAQVGVAPSTIMRIEAAEHKPSIFLVMQLCSALEISAGQLVAKLEGHAESIAKESDVEPVEPNISPLCVP